MRKSPGLINSEIAHLFSFIISIYFSRQVSLIRELQIDMNDMGAVIKVLPHLARPSDRIAKEVLAFVCIMLFNANADVQVDSGETWMWRRIWWF